MDFAYKTLGRNIRTVRKKHKMTQEQVAEALGMSVLHYGRLERGERNISLEQLTKIAETYQVSVYLLLENCFLNDFPYIPSEFPAQQEEAHALLNSLSSRDRQIVHELCRLLART